MCKDPGPFSWYERFWILWIAENGRMTDGFLGKSGLYLSLVDSCVPRMDDLTCTFPVFFRGEGATHPPEAFLVFYPN